MKRKGAQAVLLRLFQATGSFHYDLTPVPGTDLKDLKFPKLEDYFKRYIIVSAEI